MMNKWWLEDNSCFLLLIVSKVTEIQSKTTHRENCGDGATSNLNVIFATSQKHTKTASHKKDFVQWYVSLFEAF